MRDFWTIGLSGAALFLRTNGFSWPESDRLLQLKLRYERGDAVLGHVVVASS